MIKLKNKKRISVYQNIVSYRKNSTKINTCKMHVAFPVGEYYVYSKDDGYFLSLTEIAGEEKNLLFVKRALVNATQSQQQVILNTRNMFNNEPIAVTTFECEGGFFITKATKYEEENFLRKKVVRDKSGYISNGAALHLIPKDVRTLQEKGKVMICRLYTGSYVYLELFCVSEEVAKNYKTWKDLYHERIDLRKFDGCITFKVAFSNGYVSIPFDFLDKEKIKKQSILNTSIQFNVMKVELDPVICDLTGREINRSRERAYTYRVSESTKDCVKVLSKQMDPSKSVQENLSSIKKEFTSDEKKFVKALAELHEIMKQSLI